MQKKLALSFLLVTFLYTVAGVVIPRLQPDPLWSAALIISCDLVVGLGAAWAISHLLTKRLRVLAAAANVIRHGDLTRKVDVTGSDETADVARSFSAMVDSLVNIVAEVRTTSERLHDSAMALSAGSEQMNAATEGIASAACSIAQGAESQAEQVSRTYSLTRELSLSAEQVASRSRDVLETADRAAERAGEGAEAARQAASGIFLLAEKVTRSAASVEGFQAKAEEIGKIVHFISSLSQQTHLLAINAAIEAARAGEEARGFAVVAEEVRRLADHVRGFAEQISSVTDEIHQGATEVARGIRESVGAADDARGRVQRAADAFEGVVEAIHGTVDRAREISERTSRQSAAAGEVERALEEISRIAEQNVVGTEETSSATTEQTASMQEMALSAHALARSSDELKALISVFRV